MQIKFIATAICPLRNFDGLEDDAPLEEKDANT